MGLPKYLKKTYTKEELDKKVLKKLQLAHDKEFMASLFQSEKKGEWKLKEDLSKEENKRLKRIVKEIKKGKGGVKILPLVILLILAAVITVFTLFIKNPLASGLAERALESVFGATADVEGMKVSLVKSRVEWDFLAVTDESRLERNLFALGETRIQLNGRALLQKKVVIDSLECLEMRWDVPRETPGEKIPGEGQDERNISPLPFLSSDSAAEASPYAQAAVDPQGFVEEQWENLKTPALAQEAAGKYEKALNGQEEKILALKDSGEAVKEEGEGFFGQDFERYKNNPAEIPALAKEAQEVQREITSLGKDVEDELDTINELRRSLDEDRKALLRAKEDDMAHIESLVALPEGGVREIFKDVVQAYIAQLLGDKYYKAMTIYSYVEKYRSQTDDNENSAEESRRRSGRVVSFDTVVWPEFLVREALLSADAGALSWDMTVIDVAGEPDQWDKPSLADFNLVNGQGTLEGNALADRRTEPESPSSGEALFSGLPVASDALSGVGISSFSGDAGGTFDLIIEQDGPWRAASDIILSSIEMDQKGSDTVSQVAYRVLSSDDWKIGVVMEGEGDDYSFDLDWPLLNQVDDEIGEILKEQADDFLDEAQAELTRRYAGELDVLEQYTGDLDGWEKALKGDLSALDSQKKQIDDKVDEVKKEAEERVAGKAEKVLEDTGVSDAADDLGNSLKKLF